MSEHPRTIPLSLGQFAIVDACDYERLNQLSWYARWNSCTRSYYAQRSQYVPGGIDLTIQMGREVLGLPVGDRRQADHVISGLTLVNTHKNLRIATATQQCQNRRIRSDNRSGYKGVSWNASRGKWRAQLSVNGKNVLIGHFVDPVVAAQAYDARALKEFGSFALCNLPLAA